MLDIVITQLLVWSAIILETCTVCKLPAVKHNASNFGSYRNVLPEAKPVVNPNLNLTKFLLRQSLVREAAFLANDLRK